MIEKLLLANSRVLLTPIRAMGDTLLATPLIRDFKKRYPEVSIDVLVQPVPAQVIVNNPYVNHILLYPQKRSHKQDYVKMAMFIREQRYQLVVDLLSTPASASVVYFSGAPLRIGYDLRGRTWAYTTSIEKPKNVYSPLSKFALVENIGIEREGSILPEVFPSEEDVDWAAKRAEQIGFNDKSNWGALAPWSVREWRRWFDTGWISAMSSLEKYGINNWILFATDSERRFLRELELPNVLWAGTPDLLKAVCLMRHCKIMLCGENGLKHIATAAGIPTFTVYVDYEGVNPLAWDPPDVRIHRSVIASRDQQGIEKVNNAMKEIYQSNWLLEG